MVDVIQETIAFEMEKGMIESAPDSQGAIAHAYDGLGRILLEILRELRIAHEKSGA